MTTPWAIYVRPDLLVGDPRALATLLVHELVHVRQWARLGPTRFLRSYVGDYLTARRRGASHLEAYLDIGLEREARQIAGH